MPTTREQRENNERTAKEQCTRRGTNSKEWQAII